MANGKMKIGTFMTDKNGRLNGIIAMLGITPFPVITEDTITNNSVAFLKLIASPLEAAYEIGAAFFKEKDGMKYFSVILDSPLLQQPINAALFPDRNNPGQYNLVWNRPEQSGPALSASQRSTGRRFIGTSASP